MCFSGWWLFTNPVEKYAQVKLDHFPQLGLNIKVYLKPLRKKDSPPLRILDPPMEGFEPV